MHQKQPPAKVATAVAASTLLCFVSIVSSPLFFFLPVSPSFYVETPRPSQAGPGAPDLVAHRQVDALGLQVRGEPLGAKLTADSGALEAPKRRPELDREAVDGVGAGSHL